MTDHATFEPDASEPSGPRRLARWVPLVAGAVAVVAFLGFLTATSSNDDDGPSELAQFEFQAMDGSTVTLADFDGPLVVNYFAAWCPPCRAELPDFEEVSIEMEGDVVIVGVSRDNVTDSWRSLIEETGVTFPTVYEGNAQGSFAYLGANVMPTTVFVSADGTVERTWGGVLTADKLRELIDEHLT